MEEQLRNAETLARHRKILVRMLFKVTAYYVFLGAAVAIAASTIPGFVGQLPLGGVGEIADYGSSSVYDLEEALLSADDEEIEDIVTENTRARLARGPAWLHEALALIYAMSATLLLMLPVSWVYKAIHTDSVYDHSIDTTTLVLPAVVAGIVTVVQHSLALAFSLAGIVAGVRFRAWQPAESLHPTVGVHAPLVFDLWDSWSDRSVGGCVLHASHPGGRSFDDQPINDLEAEGRRLARFETIGHSPGALRPRAPRISEEQPLTLDLRRQTL